MVACFYTVEQCSAINSLSTASTLLYNFLSLVFNLKLCVTSGSMQNVLWSYLSAVAIPAMRFKLTIFRYECVIANFAKGLS